MERRFITEIEYDTKEAMVTLTKVPDRPGIVAAVFKSAAKTDSNINVIVQNVSIEQNNKTDVSFTTAREDVDNLKAEIEKDKEHIGYEDIKINDDISTVTVRGIGMASYSSVAHTLFKTLGRHNINILAISTSETKISVVIGKKHTKEAIKILKKSYELKT